MCLKCFKVQNDNERKKCYKWHLSRTLSNCWIYCLSLTLSALVVLKMAFSICMCIIFCHALIILSLIQKSRLSKIHLKRFFFCQRESNRHIGKSLPIMHHPIYCPHQFLLPSSTPHAHAGDKLERGAHVRHLRVKQAKPFNPIY